LRSKSTEFLSEFRPIKYIEMQERPRKLIKVKRNLQKNQNPCISSISNQIQSISITESHRKTQNTVGKDHEESFTEDQDDQYIYKVHNYNNLSKADKRIIANRVHRNNLRWTNVDDQMKLDKKSLIFKNNTIKQCPKVTELKKCDQNGKPLQSVNCEKEFNNFDNNLNQKDQSVITSTSNSLTNFVSIDDICEIRNELTKPNVECNLLNRGKTQFT